MLLKVFAFMSVVAMVMMITYATFNGLNYLDTATWT